MILDVRFLKEWVNSLPEDMDDFSVVVSKEGTIDESEGLTYRLDIPIISMSVDEGTKEACIFIAEEGMAAPMAPLDGSTGMGAPQYASRDADGSGDVPVSGEKKKKKKKKRKVRTWKDFVK